MDTHPLACPSCRLPDQVQQVAAIVAAGHGRLSWDLAAPPPAGGRGRARRRGWPPWAWALLGLGLLTLPLDLALLAIAAVVALFVAVAGGVLLVAAGAVWLTYRYLNRDVRAAREADRRLLAEAASNRYDHALTYWYQLAYCHRCGGVFLPGSPWQHREVVAPGMLTVPAGAWALAQRLAEYADRFHAPEVLGAG